ncbi:MAG: DNA-directed RNA polymerase subunit beta [Oscillospiraceae bacterium]|nr:DNA-directed RNA polymerase subunit beta [Oscillospiraceae bacterium]
MKTHEIKVGKNSRQSYSKIGAYGTMPNLVELQKSSYEWFVTDGLREVFDDTGEITDFSGNLALRFIDFRFEKEPKYSIEESKARDSSYSTRLMVKVQLVNRSTGELKEQEIFMGEFPVMTPQGTFVINGAERVIVSQLVRSPGIYYSCEYDKFGKKLYSNQIIPNRGAWLELETDSNDICHIHVDRTRKLPTTSFLRAMGLSTNEEIYEVFGKNDILEMSISKDTTENTDEGYLEIYKRLRPGEPAQVLAAQSLLNSMLFDPKRYDMARVGRYKYNQKLALAMRIMGHVAADDIISPLTKKVLVKMGEKISRSKAIEIEEADVHRVVLNVDGKEVVVFGNNMVELSHYVKFDCSDIGVRGKVYLPVLQMILDTNKKEEDIKKAMKKKIFDLQPRYITKDDIFASINYHLNLSDGVGFIDDIDHLGNRRIRAVGELLQNQFRVGLSRLERVVRERMTIQDLDVVTPQTLINTRPVVAAMKEFFGSSQLSQFMDQNNPLAEISHKRRLSALGPGGLNRERAGFEVRDVHYTHYSRMCPIETPEGPNVGLINNLATYARINEYGFIEAPYRKVDKKTGVVSDEVVYMTADIEDRYVIAQANEPLTKDNKFEREVVTSRFRDKILEADPEEVDFMDVSPSQVVSVATAMIPFLENDDANRALMGANMQKQAVPLLISDSPIIGTGMEHKAAKDSGNVVLALGDGIVSDVSADHIEIKNKKGETEYHKLLKFKRSNQSTCVNQKPIVEIGEKVKAGDIIADGPATDKGEIALGRNILMGFITWEGFNYEDAILISEKLVREDALTSIHIEEYECESRDTKLGREEITRDISNIGEDALKDLDENGIIRIGAEVRPGDILVGKVTPKGEQDLTAEERLLRAIFGEKAREVRDTSLRVPHGQAGIIVDVKVFTRDNGDELPAGVNQIVRVYIAEKRKISVGDKMAGRHGNKGVISRILPEEDMPFLPDGTPLEIVLNPLGVPSRMNIGQVLEVHLGYAAKALGWKIATPVFDGASEIDVIDTLKKAGLDEDGKTILYDGRTGHPFDNRVTVGYMYMLKLHHLVDDKIHARSTGPYSLVTQQPLGGKAQFGGQRFGEMEVWALEAYGAAHVLQEILTVKSDDVIGRVKMYENIIKGEPIEQAGVPESFKVLVKELQSLGLDIKILDERQNIMAMGEEVEDEYAEKKITIEGTKDMPLLGQYNVSKIGNVKQTSIEEEIVDDILEERQPDGDPEDLDETLAAINEIAAENDIEDLDDGDEEE